MSYTCMYYEKAMPKAFCDYVLNSIDWSNAKPATTYRDDAGVQNHTLRKADVVSDDEMSPLGSVCKNYLVDGNTKGKWAGSICGFDVVQVIRYEDGGHYVWHNDVLPPENGMVRSVSLSLLLNDPSEFEGGELEFKDKEGIKILKNQGDIAVFDSAADHRVTPVTKGVRYSAICWAKSFYEE